MRLNIPAAPRFSENTVDPYPVPNAFAGPFRPDRRLDGSENPGADVSAFRGRSAVLQQNVLPQHGEKSRIRKRGAAYAVPLFYQARRAKARRSVF